MNEIRFKGYSHSAIAFLELVKKIVADPEIESLKNDQRTSAEEDIDNFIDAVIANSDQPMGVENISSCNGYHLYVKTAEDDPNKYEIVFGLCDRIFMRRVYEIIK